MRFAGWFTMVMLVLELSASAQTGVAEDLTDDTRLLFVFDASNSMNAFWGGERKIASATALLSEALEELYGIEGLQLGLRVYGHQTFVDRDGQDCEDTELVVPIGTGNNLVITRALKKIQARGTTPIAHSLELAADDFPDSDGRNVIILITDGIEACDGDPCAVSRALQAKNVVVKPFIIGIGLDEQYKETFRCVGNYFDATNAEDFAEVLDVVLEQAMHDTTVEVDLIGNSGKADVSNVAVSFVDHVNGGIVEQFVHTLNHLGNPDTLHIDPVPLYDVVVHTIPELRKDSLRLDARSHNKIVFAPVKQGWLEPGFLQAGRNPFAGMPVTIFEAGSCEPLVTLDWGNKVKVLEGRYDLVFPTHPETRVESVYVGDGIIAPVKIPMAGTLKLDVGVAGFGSILTDDGLTVYKFDIGNPSGQYLLQPGRYRLLFRARTASQTDLTITRAFTIEPGASISLNING